jgi:hypothetical protein
VSLEGSNDTGLFRDVKIGYVNARIGARERSDRAREHRDRRP